MRTGTRVCLVSFGSAGDIHPLLAIGQALRARGRPVTLLTTPTHAYAAARAGLDFVPIGKAADLRQAIDHPKLWHPVDGFGVMWRYLLRPALAPTYEQLAALAARGPVTVVASPVALGARLAQEKLGLPLVTVYTAATMLRTVHSPMTLAQWRVPPWFPRAGRRAAWALLDRHKLEPLVRPALDALRAQLGLPPAPGKVFADWMHSPQGGVTLFPAWFAAPAPDWPAQVVAGGFPLYDDPGAQPLSAELAAFLDAGAPPLVFMPGTARAAADDFFLAAVRACEHLGARGVLLGAPAAALTAKLPSQLLVQPYAPFGALLPRARALVHHGGIGSSAQALRAGLPQLVVPHAYDQFDNAMRLEQLGVGATLAATALARMPQALQQLLQDGKVARACAHWAPQVEPRAGREAVVAMVERLS